MSTINVNDKNFWIKYVTTAQYEAGRALEEKPDEKVEKKALEEKTIHYSYRPVTYNYYTDNSWNLGSRVINNVNIVSEPEKKEKETEEEKKTREAEERANRAKWVGGTLVIAIAALLGYLWNLVARQLETRKYTLDVRRELNQGLNDTRLLKNDLQQLVEYQVKIDGLNTGLITNYFLSAIGVFTGGALLLAGGFKKTPPMITAGYIVTIVSVAFAAINYGLHWNDKEEINNCYRKIVGDATKELNGLADKILLGLRECNENVAPKNEDEIGNQIMGNLANEYQPLYPTCYDQTWGYKEPSAPPV